MVGQHGKRYTMKALEATLRRQHDANSGRIRINGLKRSWSSRDLCWAPPGGGGWGRWSRRPQHAGGQASRQHTAPVHSPPCSLDQCWGGHDILDPRISD
jgi:hypothetical protein